ncbi:MAG: hypothetical protein ACLTLV_00130 [Dialister invisus]
MIPSNMTIQIFHLSMDCFWCEIVSGDLVLKEREAAKWLTKGETGDCRMAAVRM